MRAARGPDIPKVRPLLASGQIGGRHGSPSSGNCQRGGAPPDAEPAGPRCIVDRVRRLGCAGLLTLFLAYVLVGAVASAILRPSLHHHPLVLAILANLIGLAGAAVYLNFWRRRYIRQVLSPQDDPWAPPDARQTRPVTDEYENPMGWKNPE